MGLILSYIHIYIYIYILQLIITIRVKIFDVLCIYLHIVILKMSAIFCYFLP